jgi:hypothetical protein
MNAPAPMNLITLTIVVPAFSYFLLLLISGAKCFLLLTASILIIARSDKRRHRLRSVIFSNMEIITELKAVPL